MSIPTTQMDRRIKLQDPREIFNQQTYKDIYGNRTRAEVEEVENTGERLYYARENAGFSIEETVALINKIVPPSTHLDESRHPEYLDFVERGRRVPNDQFLAALSLLYGATTSALLTQPEEEIKARFAPHLQTIKASMARFLGQNEKAVKAFGRVLNIEALKPADIQTGLQHDAPAVWDIF